MHLMILVFCCVMVTFLMLVNPASAVLEDLLFVAGQRRLEIHYGITFSSTSLNAKNGSIYTEEYVDETNNRRRIIVTNNAEEYNYYNDVNTSQYLTVRRSLQSTNDFVADCTTTNLTDAQAPDDLWIGLGLESQGYLRTVSNLLKHIRDKFMLISNGTAVIRGMTRDRYDGRTTVTIDGVLLEYFVEYYLSDRTPLAYDLNDTRVPLRIVLSTQGSANASNPVYVDQTMTIYDFSVFKLIGYQPTDFYNTPKGVVCKGRNPPSYNFPIPNQYSVSEEIVVTKPGLLISHNQLFFDYKLNLTRRDLIQNLPAEHGTNSLSLSLIHDVNTMLTYKRFLDNNTCIVEPLAPNPNRLLSWDIDFVNGTARLRNGSALYSQLTIHYQGQRTVRGVQVNVFTNLNDTEDIYSLMELYTTVPDVKIDNFGDYDEHQAVLGFYFLSYNKSNEVVLSETYVNLYNAIVQPLNYDVFDGDECFSFAYAERRRFGITFSDVSDAFSKGLVSGEDLGYQLRLWLAKHASVSPLRVTDVLVYDSNKEKVIDVYFTIHAPAHVTGGTQDGADSVIDQLLVEEIEVIINIRIQRGDLFVHFQDKNGKDRELVAISSATQASPTSNSAISKRKTYSSGAMAGLGIGMLLLGAIFAIVVGGIVWVKRFDINLPYTRTQ